MRQLANWDIMWKHEPLEMNTEENEDIQGMSSFNILFCPQVCLDSNAFHDGSELSHRQDRLIQPFVGHGINIINLPNHVARNVYAYAW